MRPSFSGPFSGAIFLSLVGQAAAKAQAHEHEKLGLKERHFGRPRSAHSADLPIDKVSRNGTSVLAKRFDSTKFSFYDAGLGACGKVNSAADYIVALNQEQWDGGSHCFETITITYNGKTAQAQITDMCPGCPYGGLDFSQGLFSHFASVDAGIIYGSWVFGAGEADPPQTTTKEATTTTKAPKTSSTPPPPLSSTTETPTSTRVSHSLTSTSSPSSSSTQASSTSSIPTPTSKSQVPTSATQSTSPSATPTSKFPESLALFNQAFFQLAEIINSATSAQS